MDNNHKTIEMLLAEIDILKEKTFKSEKLNESIVETATDAIITIDNNGFILSWNLAAERIFEYCSSEILSKSIFEIVSNVDQDKIKPLLKVGLTKRVGQTIELLAKRKGGEEFPVELSISKWEFGDYTNFTGIFRDITERKHKDSLFQKLDFAIQNTTDILFMTNLEGIITYVNPQFTKTYGYESYEIVGKHTPRILKAFEDKERFESLWKTLLSKESFKMSHYQNKKKDGSLIDLDSTIDPILNEHGDIVGYLGIQHDITNRISYVKKLEEAIEMAKESDRLKSEFLANMSHELRTPLNSIIGLSSLIDRDSSIDEILEFVQIINNSGEHLLKLIEDLFEISLIESGKGKVSLKDIDLGIFLNDIHESMKIHQENLGKHHIDFNLITPSNRENLIVYTDELKLKHILINLLKNAIKFSESGTINYGFRVAEKDEKTHITFFVSDTGIGIDQHHQDLIFKGFTQVNGSYNRPYDGIGIGLTIAKKLVNLLKGNMWVDSTLGKGSSFFFSFPLNSIKSDIIHK